MRTAPPLSSAPAARGVRGRPRKTSPQKRTIAAAASAAASAASAVVAATPIWNARSPTLQAESSACSSSHSEAKPDSGGRDAAAAMPTSAAQPVQGIRWISPPSRSIRRDSAPCSTSPAARNSSVLNTAWFSACSSAAPAASAASAGRSAPRKASASPSPIATSPTFSTVEQASRVLVSSSRFARSAPITADAAPSAISGAPSQKGCAGPIRSNTKRATT